jgi:hypothetical protein
LAARRWSRWSGAAPLAQVRAAQLQFFKYLMTAAGTVPLQMFDVPRLIADHALFDAVKWNSTAGVSTSGCGAVIAVA